MTSIFGVILAGYNIVCLFFKKAQLDQKTGYLVCVANADFWNIYLFHYVSDSVLYSFGPFTLMFITNCAIVFVLMRAKCKSNQSNSTESTNQALVRAAARGTTMVVTVSITFLILTAPTGVAYALRPVIYLGVVPEYRIFMNLTHYLNHSINGILYCIVGSRFRRELLKLFCRKETSSGVYSSSLVNNHY